MLLLLLERSAIQLLSPMIERLVPFSWKVLLLLLLLLLLEKSAIRPGCGCNWTGEGYGELEKERESDFYTFEKRYSVIVFHYLFF